MKIVINSHIRSDIARGHLMKSICQYEDYKQYEIIIVIGGYYSLSDYEITKDNNITYIKANNNSIDFTGLIALLELYSNDEYYLYLHDTCKIGPDFFRKLKNINLDRVTSISLTRFPSMSMGIYSQKLIIENKDFLLSRKNMDENALYQYKKWAIEFEDAIFKNDPNTKILDNHCRRVITGPTDYYGTGTMRIIEYYSNLDLYKIKSCWGQSISLNN